MSARKSKLPTLEQTAGAGDGPPFNVADFADELKVAPNNEAVGTRLFFENNRVEVWELALAPGSRAPFHCHMRDYFWTCVDAGRAKQRFDNGTSRVVDVSVGDTNFIEYAPDERTIHDLENVGETILRFVTVVLKRMK